jgi:glutathione S-transferase
MPITYETLWSAIVTFLVLLLYVYMGSRVGSMRGKHNVAAPAVSGHPEFERAFRVHVNTLEQLMIFFPLLWLATLLFRPIGWLPALLGVVFIAGRMLFMQRYMSDPKSRGPGVTICVISYIGLLVLAIIGIVQDWTALSGA